MIIWNGYTIKKVDMKEVEGDFSGVYVMTIDENVPDEIVNLEVGYYEIVGLNQYFEIGDRMLEYGGNMELVTPWGEPNVLRKYISDKTEKEYERKLKEELDAINLERKTFDNDLNNLLVFNNGIALMKNYYHKKVEVRTSEHEGSFELYLDGNFEVDIYYNEDNNNYSAYDGVDGYGWYGSIKEVVKSYMDHTCRYKTIDDGDDYYEPSCSNCGDGGCLYCEPHRFL